MSGCIRGSCRHDRRCNSGKLSPRQAYDYGLSWAQGSGVDPAIHGALAAATTEPPAEFSRNQGWVLLALQNAYFRLLHATSLANGVIETVRAGATQIPTRRSAVHSSARCMGA